uniref:Uncharacterized protein n=1 Tax=Mycena chlorophos TaxID=658473 RepID=A0ABQ0M5Q6_MYCCL|nr:predicted protein [Mycena chlorophos]
MSSAPLTSPVPRSPALRSSEAAADHSCRPSTQAIPLGLRHPYHATHMRHSSAPPTPPTSHPVCQAIPPREDPEPPSQEKIPEPPPKRRFPSPAQHVATTRRYLPI